MTSTASAPNGAARTGPPPVVPLKGAQLALGTLALSLATFMNVLDSSIANVSLPAISGDLGVSPTQGTWVITSFGVANAISVPLTGWLTQRFGAVRLFTASVLLFVLASWLCGFAPSLEALIGFRVLQGLVAGPMIPLSQTLLLSSYPPAKAGTALAMWAMTTLVAPVMGPLLGGFLTDHLSWRWTFYVSLPFGILAFLMVTRFLFETGTRRQAQLDWLGALLFTAGSALLIWGLELQQWAFAVLGGLVLVAAVGLEFRHPSPLLPIQALGERVTRVAFAGNFMGGAAYFGVIAYLPLYAQGVAGGGATAAGAILTPMLVGWTLASIAAAQLMKRIPLSRITQAGFFVLVLMFVALCTIWGRMVSTTRNRAPHRLRRLLMLPRNSAVGVPGLTPGMNPPPSRSCSAMRLGSNCTLLYRYVKPKISRDSRAMYSGWPKLRFD